MTDWLTLDAPSGEWRPAGPAAGALEVAESWLVQHGRVRGLGLHLDRLARGAADAGMAGAVPDGLPGALRRALPGTGRHFPRLELRGDGELRLCVRPAPPRAPTVVAWEPAVSDPRRAPRRKGPDLERLGRLREAAARHGAGEALLADADGRLLEGAYTSLLWWEDDVLCAVPEDAPILDGVTRRLLLGLAGRSGEPVALRRPAPADLAGREVWLTSALHGIRAVTGWSGGTVAGDAPCAEAWQVRLDALAEAEAVGALAQPRG
jgi:branched-subunit amino acid aminotransferase/4-amino-4-deoxychorismate lyase